MNFNTQKYGVKVKRIQSDEFSIGSNPQGTIIKPGSQNGSLREFRQPKSIQSYLIDHNFNKQPKEGEGEEGKGQEIEKQYMLYEKLKNFFFQIKLKNWIKRLVSNTRSRMFRTLTYNQLQMIADCAYNAEQKTEKRIHFERDNSNRLQSSKQSIFSRILSLIDLIVPVLSPHHIIKRIFDILGILSVIFLFFSLSITVSFQVKISEIVHIRAPVICCFILLIGVIIKLNASFIRLGTKVTSRYEIWRVYKKKRLASDFFSLLAAIALIFLDSTSWHNFLSQNDIVPFLKFALFFPFLLRLRNISQTISNFEDQIAFKQRDQYIVQIVRLFSIIILIDHLMACIWIFNAKFSANQSMNWIISMKAETYPWYYQYAIAFYYSTTTMTTVGYGDVTAQNLSEFILATILVMTSSGVFGFTLSQIGAIFSDISSQNTEFKKKLSIINQHMENKNVSHSLRSQIREYLEYTWKENNEKFTKDSALVVQELNEDLKKQLYLHQNKQIIEYLKKYFSEDLIQNAILLIKEEQVKPQQIIFSKESSEDICIYLLEKGSAEIYLDCYNPVSSIHYNKQIQVKIFAQILIYFHKKWKVLEEGSIFGISEFFNGERRKMSVRALGYVNLLKIQRQEFLKILKELPIDLEIFHYLKDRQLFQQDYKKIGANCQSCYRSDHAIQDCRYLHLVIDRQTHFTRLNHASYQTAIERKQSWKKIVEGNKEEIEQVTQRRYFKNKHILFNEDDTEFEEFLISNYQILEDYDEQYLKYDFSYNYINGFGSEDEEENSDGLCSSHHQFLKQETDVFKQQKEYCGESLRTIKESDYSQNKRDLFDSKFKKDESQKLEHRLRKSSIEQDMLLKDLRIYNQNDRTQYPLTHNNGGYHYYSHDIYGIEEKQTDEPSNYSYQSQSPLTQAQASAEPHSPNFILNVFPMSTSQCGGSNKSNAEPPTSIIRKISMRNSISQQQSSIQQNQQHERKQKRNVSFSQFKTLHQKKESTPQQQYQQNQFKSSDINPQKNINSQMKDFQKEIVNQMQEMLNKTQIQKKIALNESKMSTEETEMIAMRIIFCSFDKQKNFPVYFPHNNLSSILFSFTSKKNLSQQQYLYMIQTVGNKRSNTSINFPSFSYVSRNKLNDKISSKKKKSVRYIQMNNGEKTSGDLHQITTLNALLTNNGGAQINTTNSMCNLNGTSLKINQIEPIYSPNSPENFIEHTDRFFPQQITSPHSRIQNNASQRSMNNIFNYTTEKQFDQSVELNQNEMIAIQSPNVKEDPSELAFDKYQSIQFNFQKKNANYFTCNDD